MQNAKLGFLSVSSIGSAFSVLLLDQISKYLIVTYHYSFIYNDGIAFSLPLTNTIALLVSFILIILLIVFGQSLYSGSRPVLFKLSLGIVVGGAISNLIDRFYHPGVIDFIKIPYWPTFNLADIAVCLGIGLMMVLLYQEQKNSSDKAQKQ